MVEWLKDPYDVTKAAHYLQWQAKYFKHAINLGNSLQFAYSQFGEKAYPIGSQSTPYTVGSGKFEANMLPDMQDKLIMKAKDKISFSIFIGKDINMDIYSAMSIVEIIKKYGIMNIELVFLNQKSKDVFVGAVASVWQIDKIRYWKNIKKIVDPAKFKQFNIFTTPSYVIKLNTKKKKEALTILHGKVDSSSFRSKVIGFMELRKLINYKKDYTEHRAWDGKDGAETAKDLYQKNYGVKVDKLFKKGGK